MEKRLVVCILLCFAIVVGHTMLKRVLFPRDPAEVAQKEDGKKQDDKKQDEKPQDAKQGQAKEDNQGPDGAGPGASDSAANEPNEGGSTPAEPGENGPAPPSPQDQEQATVPETPQPDLEWVTLGGADKDFHLLVVASNRGAAIESIELTERTPDGDFRYRDLQNKSGYLGPLAPHYDASGGAIGVVGKGTAADRAGVKAGDLLTRIDDKAVSMASTIDRLLAKSKPGQKVELTVERVVNGEVETLTLVATLDQRPLALVHPEPRKNGPRSSFLMSLRQFGKQRAPAGPGEWTKLPSLEKRRWELKRAEDGSWVEFSARLDADTLKQAGLSGDFEILKRFQLKPIVETPTAGRERDGTGYHLGLEIELVNHSDEEQKVAYRLEGPNGLPLEGWWYSNKIGTEWFKQAGARDVAYLTDQYRLVVASQLHNHAEESSSDPRYALFDPVDPETMKFIGVDVQYFHTALLPVKPDGQLAFAEANALQLDRSRPLEGSLVRTANVTYQVTSKLQTIPPKSSHVEKFVVFAGPKNPELLSQYELGDTIVYGMQIFEIFARPLSGILHFFYMIVGNYGLAIIMLTILVRSAMFPISRKAAKNAAKMQELAPEMKAINDKYKNDLEKRGQAMRELYAKHQFNPFGGCLLMFVQLPVFIGLYKCLSVDIELRQAPLIPGLQWCSNLAGPDMLFRWDSWLHSYLSAEGVGWLGPYFNLLPVITIVLFLIQQKLFTPPPTDDQTRMQHNMMKFMMVFMGVLFFRVPSGLCVYFIASSLWGIAERKLLPKSTPVANKDETASTVRATGKAPVKPAKPAKPATKKAANPNSLMANLLAKANANGTQRNTNAQRNKSKRKNRKR